MRMFSSLVDRFFGRGDYSVSVPPMDGALRPNERIEQGTGLYQGVKPDNLVTLSDRLVFSDGPQLMDLDDDRATPIGTKMKSDIVAMAAFAEDVVFVTVDGSLWRGKPESPSQIDVSGGLSLSHVTAIAGADNGDVYVAVGSSKNSPENWTRDLMERRSAGSLWRIPSGGGSAEKLASDLAWPAGVLLRSDGIYVSEAWRHRIIKISSGGQTEVTLAHLPGYPGHLCEDGEGGVLMSVFAPRSQLVELVLRQSTYRRRMMEEVPQHLWVAPAYGSGKSFLEPLQGGGVKQMGILKPWAPSRSCGLVVRLNDKFHPYESIHSRANGKRHGVTSAVLRGGDILATTRGSGEIVAAAGQEES